MIDYISTYKEVQIDEKQFSPSKWIRISSKYGYCYFHNKNSVDIKYYPLSQKIWISGKISTLFSNSQVTNVDDIFGANIKKFIDSVNKFLQKLFDITTIDIRDFKVARIDYCFNVKTPYVTQYLEFLRKAFQHKSKGSRTDFTYDRNLSGSVYIKPTSEYNNNQKKSYCLNFYDKKDWIYHQKEKNIYVSPNDEELATDVFRLEVQCYSNKVKGICKKYHMDNTFGNLCDISVAYNTICEVYKNLFGGDENCSYVQYGETKNVKFTPTVKEQLKLSSQHHSITTYAAQEAIKKGIYPYYFLPSNGEVKRLENPMMLILNKISQL